MNVYVVMMFFCATAALAVGLNIGYDTGYRSGKSDAIMDGISMGSVECHYKK